MPFFPSNTGSFTIRNFNKNSPRCDFLGQPHYYALGATVGKGKNQTEQTHTFPTTTITKKYKDIKQSMMKKYKYLKRYINLKEM